MWHASGAYNIKKGPHLKCQLFAMILKDSVAQNQIFFYDEFGNNKEHMNHRINQNSSDWTDVQKYDAHTDDSLLLPTGKSVIFSE